MKRIIAIILLMCIFALSGCNTASPDTNGTSDNTETIPNESTNIPNQDISQGSIEEKHFVLESNGYKLNAVYTYIDDGNAHPAVLLIAGSGPSDYDETLGTLKPFKDIANGLAKEGINSLRVDKRTFSYAANFDIKCGIEEEYLDDCNAAIEYLKSQNISGLYLLGHSLGGVRAGGRCTGKGIVVGFVPDILPELIAGERYSQIHKELETADGKGTFRQCQIPMHTACIKKGMGKIINAVRFMPVDP